MVLQTTIDMLVGMKMTAMAAELSSQLQDASFNELGFEDRLGLLVTAERNRRQTNTVKRLIHSARFAAPFAAVEQLALFSGSLVSGSLAHFLRACGSWPPVYAMI